MFLNSTQDSQGSKLDLLYSLCLIEKIIHAQCEINYTVNRVLNFVNLEWNLKRKSKKEFRKAIKDGRKAKAIYKKNKVRFQIN